jgi:hypothetical protein
LFVLGQQKTLQVLEVEKLELIVVGRVLVVHALHEVFELVQGTTTQPVRLHPLLEAILHLFKGQQRAILDTPVVLGCVDLVD